MSFRFDAGNMLNGIAERELRTKAALGVFADSTAKKMERHAKTNYKWTPRSGRAHQSLFSEWKWQGNKIVISLAHGVDYGVYLEFCNEKRYAIIQPTIDAISPDALKGLEKILK